MQGRAVDRVCIMVRDWHRVLDLPCICVCAGQNPTAPTTQSQPCAPPGSWAVPLQHGDLAGLPVQQIAQVTFDIAHAVEELAKLMIVHRDISPNNIGYQDDAHGCHGWLYDFGAAKVGLGQT